jgi:hypothetical protein
MNELKVEMHDSLKKLTSEILCLADHLSAEILIGIQLNSFRHRIWSTNGTTMREKLMTDGLKFDEADDFYGESDEKEATILEEVSATVRQTLLRNNITSDSN